jgi:hypothetical protein
MNVLQPWLTSTMRVIEHATVPLQFERFQSSNHLMPSKASAVCRVGKGGPDASIDPWRQLRRAHHERRGGHSGICAVPCFTLRPPLPPYNPASISSYAIAMPFAGGRYAPPVDQSYALHAYVNFHEIVRLFRVRGKYEECLRIGPPGKAAKGAIDGFMQPQSGPQETKQDAMVEPLMRQ